MWQSKKKKKKKDPESYFLTSSDHSHAPGANFLHYCILLFITFDLICNMTVFVQNGFWTLRGHTPWPCPQMLHQNFKYVPPVLIDWAITCDSFQVLAQKAFEDLCDNRKKKDPKSYILTSSDPQTWPGAKSLHHCILLIWNATWLCLYKMDFGTFGATPPGLASRGNIRIPNVFLQSSSMGLSPVKVSRF